MKMIFLGKKTLLLAALLMGNTYLTHVEVVASTQTYKLDFVVW